MAQRPVRLDRDAIVAGVDLPQLADTLLGPRRGAASSPAWTCPMPDHDAAAPTPPHIATFTTRRGEQRWQCANCGADGTAIDLVMRAQGLGLRDALEFLARRSQTALLLPSDAGDDRTRLGARTGLDAWVRHASGLLWKPYGETTRHWLTHGRRLPEEVLRFHRIGASSITALRDLPTRRSTNGHRSSAPAAVLPVVVRGRAVHAQLRLIQPQPDQAPYVNPRSSAEGRPRLALYRPPQRRHPEIIVTEGIIDALSANAAGYRAAAILAPGLADAEVAVHLARLNGPLVLALDPDEAGGLASDRLACHLWTTGRRPALLAELKHDLNGSLVAANDWPRKLASHVRQAVMSGPPDRLSTL
jgi:hypothetical protein